MAVIISIETSTSVCSAALHENANLVAAKEVRTPHSAASQLAVQIEELFRVSKITKEMVDAVAVSSGPGSYTGLRIGVATAKGICYGLNVPLIGIDSLQVLASSVNEPPSAEFLCPMIDARRMEVYCTVLDGSLNVIEDTQAKIIDSTSFKEVLSHHSILFFGDGAAKCQTSIRHPNALFLENVYPTAARMGILADQKFQAHQFADLALFEPNYLKDFVAKTKSA